MTDRPRSTYAWPPGGVWSANGDHVPRTKMPDPVEVTAETVTGDHASAAGEICTDDGTGCCSTCGVSLDVCEQCSGVGYHQAGCPDSDVTDEKLTNELTHEQITYARDNIARLPGSLQIVDITLALACDAALSGDPAPEAKARIAAAINASTKADRRG